MPDPCPVPQHTATVIIPTFNRADFLARSIGSCLEQGTARLRVEVIVVDDGSTDDTLRRLEACAGDVQVFCLPHNCGRNVARNKGLEQASGEFVKFLDSDDFLEP